jgi:hypothetical protein
LRLIEQINKPHGAFQIAKADYGIFGHGESLKSTESVF